MCRPFTHPLWQSLDTQSHVGPLHAKMGPKFETPLTLVCRPFAHPLESSIYFRVSLFYSPIFMFDFVWIDGLVELLLWARQIFVPFIWVSKGAIDWFSYQDEEKWGKEKYIRQDVPYSFLCIIYEGSCALFFEGKGYRVAKIHGMP